MVGVFQAIKEPAFLDTQLHKELRVKLPKDYSFCWDVDKVLELYPFSVVRTKEGETKQWTVVFDMAWEDKEGDRLFDEEGNETPFFLEIKSKLGELAFDFENALNFSKELSQMNCLKLIQSLEIDTQKGRGVLNNILIGDIDNLSKLSPEKLYILNSKGYLPILYSVYFSVRNFKLFDLL